MDKEEVLQDHIVLGDKADITHEELAQWSELTEEELAVEKKLKRRIDALIMPMVILVYLMNYIDRFVGLFIQPYQSHWSPSPYAIRSELTGLETTMLPHVFKVLKTIFTFMAINTRSASLSSSSHISSCKYPRTCYSITSVDRHGISGFSQSHGVLYLP